KTPPWATLVISSSTSAGLFCAFTLESSHGWLSIARAAAGRDTMQLHLASTSPARLQLLRQSGIEPVVIPSHVDEDAAVAAAEAASGSPLSPEETVGLLARAKAESVWRDLPAQDCLILGGDSVFVV